MILIGCSTVSNNVTVESLDLPPKPEMLNVEHKVVEGGFFTDYQNMKNLDINLERLDTYIKKLFEHLKIKTNTEVKK